MPKFSHEAPSQGDRHGFRLVRTPASPPFRAFVISENLIGCPTHYVANRTIPCESPNCEPCENGIGWRWHGYLLVQIEATSEQVIFEMTAAASDAFKKYYERHGTTRGCYFQATRANNRSNGRVLIQCKPADLQKINLPQPLNLIKLLSHIWNIPPNQTQQAESHPRAPAINIRTDRTRPEIYTPKPSTIDPTAHLQIRTPPDGNGKRPPVDPSKQ